MTKTATAKEAPGAESEPSPRPATGGKGRKRNSRGRPGGEESRARILETAGQMFAARGFDGVSTRELARAAEVNISAITYYFNGKKGLYKAVIRQLIHDTAPVAEPMVTTLTESVRAAGDDRPALSDALTDFVEALLGAILTDPKLRWQMPLVMREFQQPSSAFDVLLAERINPMHNAVAELVGAARGIDPESDEAILVTAAVIGQCMAFGFARTVIFARTGWQDYAPENRRRIIAAITPAILGMLGLPVPPRLTDDAR